MRITGINENIPPLILVDLVIVCMHCFTNLQFADYWAIFQRIYSMVFFSGTFQSPSTMKALKDWITILSERQRMNVLDSCAGPSQLRTFSPQFVIIWRSTKRPHPCCEEWSLAKEITRSKRSYWILTLKRYIVYMLSMRRRIWRE